MGTRRRSTATAKSRKRQGSVGSSAPVARNERFIEAPDADVRVEKVARVREAIASGKYRVSASKVAAKVMDEMRRT